MHTRKDIDLDALRSALITKSDQLIAELLPNAKPHGTHLRVGSIHGESGSSLAIERSSGLWIDHATGQRGDLLDLIRHVNGCSFKDAIDWAAKWLGRDFRQNHARQPPLHSQPKAPANRQPPALRAHASWHLRPPNNSQISAIARLLEIGTDGLILAAQRAHLFCGDDQLFTLSDTTRHVRADRRLDGQKLVLSNGKQVKTRTVGSATWPLGAADFGKRPYVLLCEGFSDFLAGYHLVAMENVGHLFSVCTVLGAGIAIHPDAIAHFENRAVIIFADADGPGIRGARRWRDQLNPHCKAVRFFNLRGLRRNDGEPVKDLRDFLSVHVDAWESEAEIRYPLCNFIQQFRKR